MRVETSPRKLRKIAVFAAFGLAAILLPALALGVPGSGDMVALEAASGREITGLYNIIAKVCLAVLIIVEGVLIFAVFRFRRRSDEEMPEQIHGNMRLEVGWTLAALAIQVYIGWITVDTMFEVETIPETEITVEAIAYQWDWQFRYPDHGGFITEDLVVPAHTNVKLEVTSKDVIHAIFIPELGVKIDAVPGRFNYWWFNADGPINQTRVERNAIVAADQVKDEYVTTRPDWWAYLTGDAWPDYKENYYLPGEETGKTNLERRVAYLGASRKVGPTSPYAKYNAVEYRGMCAELCGKGHWDMYFRTVAMTKHDFEQWVVDVQAGGGEVNGAEIYAGKCASCHGSDGQGIEGQFPPLVGARWTTEEGMKKDHIEVVLNGLKGEVQVLGTTYNGVMQPWADVLNDAEVAAVVNHERTSWGNDGGEVTEEMVAEVREGLGLPPFPAGGTEPVPDAELMTVGARVYEACVTCHGAEGKGPGNLPNLAGNPKVLADPAALVETLVQGQDTDRWPSYQPPMGKAMSNRQLAGVLTYIRKSFGNEASAVQPDEVARIRGELKE